MTYTIPVAPYEPSQDSHGRTDVWADPVDVAVYGWAPARADEQPVQSNRHPVQAEREVYPVTETGGPRARWTFPDGVFEQVGHAANYSDGPWWTDAEGALVVLLRRTEG